VEGGTNTRKKLSITTRGNEASPIHANEEGVEKKKKKKKHSITDWNYGGNRNGRISVDQGCTTGSHHKV